jgi:hypothetical protein
MSPGHDAISDFAAARAALVASGCGYHDVADREPVSLGAADAARIGVFVTLGQSQTANAGEVTFAARDGVLNLNPFDGKLYQARDPLLGCNDEQGNFASRLGDLLVAEGLWDKVVLLPIGVGGSAVAEWAPGGVHHHRIAAAIGCLREARLRPTAVLWAQGEADAIPGADGRRYREKLRQVIDTFRTGGMDAPFHVAVSTFCNVTSDGNAVIRAAQRAVVAPAEGIFAGPDTDRLGIAYRYDNCHFTDEGLWAVARLWADILRSTARR